MKYTKGKFKMGQDGVQLEAILSPWLRFCIGLAILLIALSLFAYVVRWW